MIRIAMADGIDKLRDYLSHLAESRHESVYLIAKPHPDDEPTPYGVRASQASEYERQHGELIEPRKS